MGGGGYVAGPVGLAAITRRVPLVLTEADNHLGLSNRALAPFARRVCLAFPLDGHRRADPRYRVTGRPIPAPTGPRDRAAARSQLGVPAGATCVLVFGGSLGARSINLAALEAFADGDAHVLHVTGRRDYPELSSRPRRPGYDLIEYLDVERFTTALAAADLVVARAGGSVFELAAAGAPAVLIPYPYASADHQTANARWMADAGAAVVIPDGELTPERLAAEAGALLADPGRLAGMAAGLARPRPSARRRGHRRRAARRGVMSTDASATLDPAPWRGRRLHFVGVGGAGMSAYARAAHALGAEVTGSDRATSPFLERLAADGVLQASVGHAAANVPPGDDVELVYSTAIPPENPERAAARERGLVEQPRAALLEQLSALRRTIAVAGAAGKTTTASMVVHALRGAGLRTRMAHRRDRRRGPGQRGVERAASGSSWRPTSRTGRCSASTSRSRC